MAALPAEITGADPRRLHDQRLRCRPRGRAPCAGHRAVQPGRRFRTARASALEYLRRHPASIRTVVLDSVVPPTPDPRRRARAQPRGRGRRASSRAALPTRSARNASARRGRELDELLAAAARAAGRGQYRDPLTNEPRTDHADSRRPCRRVVRLHAYAPQLFAHAADAAGRGRRRASYEILMAQSRMIEQLLGEQISCRLQLSVSCAEDAPWMRADPADAGTLLGTAFVDFALAQCEVWPRGSDAGGFPRAVQADAPGAAAVRRVRSGHAAAVRRRGAAHAAEFAALRAARTGPQRDAASVACRGWWPISSTRADAQALDAGCLDQLHVHAAVRAARTVGTLMPAVRT